MTQSPIRQAAKGRRNRIRDIRDTEDKNVFAILVLVLYRARNPLMQHVRRGYAALTNSEDDNENGSQQREARGPQGRIEAPYRDEVTEGVSTRTEDQGDRHMAVQPSSLREHENQWGD
ncbi:MAG: hypothetical protein Q9218_005334 [Villophora microphyllina]